MVFHPDLGYVVDGIDFSDSDLYKSVKQPFGQAKMLPPFAYQSKTFSDLEDEKIWTRSWIAIGATHQMQNPGDLLPFTVGHHGIHVQKNENGSLIGRFNKAQHGGCRSVPLQCQTGTKTKCSFTSCGYSRDRNVIRVEEIGENTPTMHQYLGLIPERLLPVKVETWGPFVFVNLDSECKSLATSLGNLPTEIGRHFNANLKLQSDEWFECESNWKLAGRAFYDTNCINKKTLAHIHNSNEIPNYFLVSYPALSEISNGEDHSEDLQVCWLFPNLLIVISPSFTLSAILQPTSMGECLLRTCLFSNDDDVTTRENAKLPELLQNFIQTVQTRAKSMQEQADNLTAPGKPKLEDKMIPHEKNLAGYFLHRYVTKQIETEHNYYWNAPLYSNPRG